MTVALPGITDVNDYFCLGNREGFTELIFKSVLWINLLEDEMLGRAFVKE